MISGLGRSPLLWCYRQQHWLWRESQQNDLSEWFSFLPMGHLLLRSSYLFTKFIVNVSIVGLTHVHVNIHHLSYSYNQVLDIYLLDTTWHSCEVWHTSKHVLFQTVCSRLGIEVNDRLSSESKKRKFLVKSLAPEEVSKLLQCLYSEHLFSCFCRELAIVP